MTYCCVKEHLSSAEVHASVEVVSGKWRPLFLRQRLHFCLLMISILASTQRVLYYELHLGIGTRKCYFICPRVRFVDTIRRSNRFRFLETEMASARTYI